jgi:hypothetical protein
VKHIGALAIAAVVVTGGCGAPATTSSAAAAAHGRWQVIAFTPAEDTDVDGAILLDTQTGDSYVLCEYASAWCKLDRNE